MTVIARYYRTMKQARAAYQELLDKDFSEDAIALVTMPSKEPEGENAATRTGDVAASALKAGRLLGRLADFYSSQLSPGSSLVVVQPPFGQAEEATDILERHEPLDITHKPPREPMARPVPWSRQPAPFSGTLRLRTLSDSAAPFSEFLYQKTLSENRSTFLARWFKPLTGPNFHFSSMFGFGLLSNNASPFSEMFRLPIKSNHPTGDRWTHSLGQPLLSKSQRAPERRFGFPLLASRKRYLYNP